MLDLILLIIRGVGSALGYILNASIYWSDGITLHVYDVVVFIALLMIFIKLFAVITNNSVVNKKG